MKYFLAVIIFVSVSVSVMFAQTIQKESIKDENISSSYPIDGSHLLWQEDQKVAKYMKDHPEIYSQMKMKKTTSWGFNVGSAHAWFGYDFVTSQRYTINSTCRGIGNHCYVFVEDAVWNNKVNQAAVDSVVNEFENKTPANSNKGVYQTDVDAFGNPPDVDNDPRIIILIQNIKDGYDGAGGWIAGYFSSYNETNQYQSNQAEIYYMDCNPTDLTTSDGLEVALETTAHEFQHMINWNYHKTNPEVTFINEGCSMLAEINCGYPSFLQSLYAGEPNHYLLDWRTNNSTLVLNDYARAQRFFLYWLDQFGIGIFKNIVQNGLSGISGLNNALALSGQSTTFTKIFINWEIANKLNNTSVNPAYGYVYPNLPASTGKIFYNPNVSYTDTVDRLAAEYLTFVNGSNLNITFTPLSTTNSTVIKAIEIGSSSTRVVDVPLNSNFSVPEYGTVYNTIHFVIIDTNQISKQIVKYTASGTAESSTVLQWDNTEPSGYYVFSPSDTLCVTFDAVLGGTLDSIKIAMRRSGSMTGGIWEYSGVTRPTPLGKPLAVPITATINDSTTVPYPVPYKNWCTVDLTSKSISTDQPFAVGFVVGAVPSAPGIMSTDYPGQDAFHSYTYLHNPGGSSTPNWYYITSSSSTVAIYLIRAYVSFKATGINEVLELTPKEFSLSQNYPNPFNPSTTIDFALPKPEKVKITVYNQLGQQIMQFADRNYPAGNHSINFNASNLASGVYYYRIDTGDFTQTRKMVLLK